LVLSGNLYKWVDENGNIHYGDEFPTETPRELEKFELQPINSFKNLAPNNKFLISEELEAIDKKDIFEASKTKNTNRDIKLTDCFSPSPLANDTPLKREKLTKEQHKSLSDFLSKMKGSWHGQAIYFDCKEETNAPRILKQRYTSSAEVRLKRFKELTMNFKMYSVKKRITKHENIELFLSDEHLSFSHYQSDETVMLNAAEHHVELWVEYFPVAGVRNELVRIFEIKNKLFTIKQFQYINGALTSIMLWNLVK